MNRWTLLLAVLAVATFVAIGCSGGGGSPVTPTADQELTAESNPTGQNRTHLWGYYDVIFDVESRSVEVVPNRAVEFTVNIVKFLNNDPMGIQFSFNGTTPGSGYVDVDLDVTIKHPLDDTGFNGYDVRGIFIGNGSGTLAYNTDLKYPANGTDQMLLSADGYSRWFNPGEFMNPGLFGYTQGNYASKTYTGTATLNPYKYFGEGLGASDDLWSYLTTGAPNTGCFLAGSSNTRNYQVRLPIPLPGIKYGYAVTANWEGKLPQHHPSNAPEALGCVVEDNSTLYYVDETSKGGDLVLGVSVFDWDAELIGGVMEDYIIFVESSVLRWVHVFTTTDMTPIGGGDHYSTYHVEIPADNVTSVDGNEMWVIVEDSNTDYTNPFGIPNDADTDLLAACFRFDLEVASEPSPWIEVLIPNGGEEWESGTSEEITWTSQVVTGTVFIDYSRDNFVSDISMIALGEPNDGSFMWEDIPDDPSDTVRVRVSSTDDPSINDVSDADFTILHPSITVLIPNGGEEWETGSYKEITWDSEYVSGTVFIEYSKDNFVSDINLIASGELNDGSFMWDPIPDDYSDTVRVRVSSTDDPDVNDISDGDFSIVDSGWARTWGGSDEHYGRGVATDGSGNVYVTGCYRGTVDFDPGGGDPHTSNGLSDVFLSKFDSSGNFEWARTWGGLDSDEGYGVAVDGSGNVYVTGWFYGTADFDPGGGDPHTSNGWADVFLSKFDSLGNFEWARNWGGSSEDGGFGVAADGSGNVYVTGHFNGTVDFDPGSGEDWHAPNGDYDVFLSKFDSSGNFEWARTWGGSARDRGYGVATDGSGNVYVTGCYRGTVDFDPDGGDSHTSNGWEDVFLSKFDSSGNFEWARTWGGPESEFVREVAVDGSGNGYVVGFFQETVDFDPGGGDPHTSSGYEDVFLSKFDSSGNFDWARTWGGPYSDSSFGVAADSSGNIYVSGYFADTADFDPGGGDPHTSNGWDDVFLSKFDSSGNFEWARTWGGSSSDEGLGVAADGSGNVYVTGYFEGTVDFAPTDPPCNEDPDEHNSNGWSDIFLTRHLPDGCW